MVFTFEQISQLNDIVSSSGWNTSVNHSDTVVQVVDTLVTCSQNDELDEFLTKCLGLVRHILKLNHDDKEKSHFEVLHSQELIALLLKLGGDSTRGTACQVEALSCIANAIYHHYVGFKNFESEDGSRRIIEILQREGSHAILHRCIRILNLSIQSLKGLINNDSTQLQSKLDSMVTVLAPQSTLLLAYCVHKDGGALLLNSESPSGLFELCQEVLLLQVLLASELSEDAMKSDSPQSKDFTQLGLLLAEIMLLPLDIPRACELKAKVLNLLTFMPKEYSYFISANNVFPAMLEVLERHLHYVLVQEERHREEELILPCLMVLLRATESNPYALKQIEMLIFGESEEEKTNDEKKTQSPGKNNMGPDNAPPGSMQYYLFQLMNIQSQTVSTLTNEFLWNLCHKDSNLFIKRTGLGNAVGLLQVKGLLNFT